MSSIKAGILLCVMGALLFSGCTSTRVVTDLKPGKNPELKSPAGTFYIADFKFATINPNPQIAAEAYAETRKEYQRQLLPLLQKECSDRYPALFAKDSAYAIPLSVTEEQMITLHKAKMIVWMYVTGFMTLPCPTDSDEDITIKAGVWTGREDMQSIMLQKSFRREIHSWMSIFTPLALITIPGESDFPKVSGTLSDVQKMAQVDSQQRASQMATALAEMVAAKDPEFWTAQPRWTGSPVASPVNSGTVPETLPLPSEPVAPF